MNVLGIVLIAAGTATSAAAFVAAALVHTRKPRYVGRHRSLP